MKNDLQNLPGAVRFTGHETFPLRLLWLKKAYDAAKDGSADRRTFQEHDAIARFGVGKNMAMSIRHWAITAGILESDGDYFRPTRFGQLLLADDVGLDPFIEKDTSLWLVHAQIAGAPEMATTFFYAFNLLNQTAFSREDLVESLLQVVKAKGVRATSDTIKRDVEVFVRSYVARRGDSSEDAAEPLLAELGLVREVKNSGQLEFVRGPKNSLSDGVFALVLKRFWSRWHPDSPTISVEQASYGVGSPGRIFKLDEDSLVSRMMRIAESTNGLMRWTDTAGLRQVGLQGSLAEIDDVEMVRRGYGLGLAA